MRILILILAASMLAAFGCGTTENHSGIKGSGVSKSETRGLSGFKKIKAGNAVTLDVAANKEFRVTVEADDNLIEHVTTRIDGDSLVIGTHESISTKSDIRVTVSLPELSALDISDASTALVAGVSGNELKLAAGGASKVTVAGVITEFDAEAEGASSIDAAALQAENAEAEATGASTITVNAAGKAILSASGASTIVYIGDPRELEQDSSGASTIRKE